MTGDITNVTPWADADVYVGPLTATNPTSGAAFSINKTRTATVTTTNSSTSITGTFTSADVGSTITATGIPVNATIVSQTGTAAVISAAATASGSVSAVIGITGAWDLEGLLDGAAGFSEDQTWTDTPYYAWGVGEIGATKKNLTIQRTFTAMEVDSKVGLAQRYDTTGVTFVTGGFSGDLARRDLQSKFKLGFEVRSGGVIDRRITKNYAQIASLGAVVYNEDAPPSMLVTVKIYPDLTSGKPVYWSTFKGASS